MRLIYLAVAAILAAGPAHAQQAQPSSPDTGASTQGDEQLPVSIDRIRDALANPPSKPLVQNVPQADFAITVEEKVILEDFFRPEDFKTGPAPAGGLYGYQQQQVLSNKVDQPLAQPYAAYSGGELITLAIQGLLFKYLGEKVVDQAVGAQKAAEEDAARENVLKAIRDYCAAQPANGAAVEICAPPAAPR